MERQFQRKIIEDKKINKKEEERRRRKTTTTANQPALNSVQVSWSSSWRKSIFMWRSLCGTKYRQCLLGCGPLFRVRLIFCATFCSFHVLLYVLLCFCWFVCFPTDWGLNARLKAHLHDRKIEYRPLNRRNSSRNDIFVNYAYHALWDWYGGLFFRMSLGLSS